MQILRLSADKGQGLSYQGCSLVQVALGVILQENMLVGFPKWFRQLCKCWQKCADVKMTLFPIPL
jgi:hypothetical protein